jgi:hypothetical protein
MIKLRQLGQPFDRKHGRLFFTEVILGLPQPGRHGPESTTTVLVPHF